MGRERAHIASKSFSVVQPGTEEFSKAMLNLQVLRKSTLAWGPTGSGPADVV